ncbi:SSI family serine proteinase inhibitor [Streptomyces sp. NPDC059740]|uniref:SSI family serine proteinase inhibitor n=1 Tax=Streptomyces sp. NPDC059740 TaxID=3346926 RepID=UPI00365970F0
MPLRLLRSARRPGPVRRRRDHGRRPAGALVALASAALAVTAVPTAGATPAGSGVPVAAPAVSVPVPPPVAARGPKPTRTQPDHLTVRVTGSGNRAYDGNAVELVCHPTGGTHPMARDACDRLDKATTWRADPFAPVDPHAQCTLQYGGPATAHVTGVWAGRPVDATFRRTNGCEITRWKSVQPLLPGAGW